MKTKKFTVNIRRGFGWEVKPSAEQLDGKTFNFYLGWEMDEDDPCPGEEAWIPQDENYPADAPRWIASGDLVEVILAKGTTNEQTICN